jgi:hypothetical protein
MALSEISTIPSAMPSGENSFSSPANSARPLPLMSWAASTVRGPSRKELIEDFDAIGDSTTAIALRIVKTIGT